MNKIFNLNKSNLLKILLFSMCFQNIEIINFGTFGLKLFHIVGICFFPLLILNRRKIMLPSKTLTYFLIYLLTISIVNMFQYGFHSLNFNYLFSYYLLILLFTIARDINRDEWEKIVKDVAVLVLICVYINAFLNRNIIIAFLKNPYGHPVYEFVFGGGANLEATWIGMFGLFFKDDKRGYIYILLCTLISAMLASRVGIIINVITFLFITFGKNNNNKRNHKKIICGIILLIFAIILIAKTGIMDYLLSRLENIGVDTGSTARLLMWQYVFEAFLENPFGYGLGNSIKAINTVSSTYIGEGNIHNLYFQMLLDAGILGLIFYLGIIAKFIKSEFFNILKNPVVMYLVTYFVLGLVQFRGGDALMFFFVGIYVIEKQQTKLSEKRNNYEKNQENAL